MWPASPNFAFIKNAIMIDFLFINHHYDWRPLYIYIIKKLLLTHRQDSNSLVGFVMQHK